MIMSEMGDPDLHHPLSNESPLLVNNSPPTRDIDSSPFSTPTEILPNL